MLRYLIAYSPLKSLYPHWAYLASPYSLGKHIPPS